MRAVADVGVVINGAAFVEVVGGGDGAARLEREPCWESEGESGEEIC